MSAIIPTVATTKVTTVTASVSDVGGAITPVYVFDGSTMYATMADWVPLGLPFSVELKAIPLTAPVAHGVIYGTGGLYPYIRLTASGVSARYGGAATSPTRTVSVPAVVGELLEVSDVGLGTGSVITSNGVEVETPGFVMNVSSVANNYGNIARKPDGTEFFHGPIWDLKLTDNSPIQDTDVLDGNGTRYISFPDFVIPASDDFIIDIDLIYTGATIRVMGFDTSGNNRITINTAPAVTVHDDTGFNTVQNIGVSVGEHFKITLTRISGLLTYRLNGADIGSDTGIDKISFNRILSNNNTQSASTMQNVKLHNTTTNEFVHYKIDEGAGTEILAYDAAGGLLPLLDGTVTPDAAWSNIPNNSRYYPMRDGIPGAGVLQDVIGGHDATIVNYDENSWDYEPTQTITTASNAGTIGWLKDSYGDISRQQVQGYQRRMTSVRVDTVGDMAYIEWDIENLYPDITGIFLYWNGIGLLLNRTTPTSGLFSVAIPPTPETNWIAADGIERGISITAVKG